MCDGLGVRVLLAVVSVVSGCSNPFSSSNSTAEWDQAVKRETNNPQIYGLSPGTANVFELELSLPRGATAESLATAEELILQRRVKELRHTLDRNDRSALPDDLEVRARVRFTVIHPAPGQLREMLNDDCRACDARAQHRLRSFGSTPFDLQSVTAEQLNAGVEVKQSASFELIFSGERIDLPISPAGRAVVKLVESCPAKVEVVTRDVTVGQFSGIMTINKTAPRSWVELREATCATESSLSVIGGPIPQAPYSETNRLIQQLELEQN